MKIGFSLGRCVRDIVMDKVKIDDVLVIVTRTRIPKREQLDAVVEEYMYEPRYLRGLDYDRCLAVAQQLWDKGKFHQPRMVNAHPERVAEEYIWMDVVPTSLSDNPVVESAWNAYKVALRLDGRETPALPDLDDNF